MIAKTLYTKSGYQNKGIHKEGRSGLMEIMEYRLDKMNMDMEKGNEIQSINMRVFRLFE